MKKIVYRLLGFLFILALAITFLVNPIGKNYAQKYAQNLLKTPVNISQFDISLINKRLNIDFIEVQNPPNFNDKNALSLDHFSLKMGDFDDNLIVIDQLFLDKLVFTLEQNGTHVNLTELIKNLENSEAKSTTSNTISSTNTSSKRIKINKIKVHNISLKVDTKWLKTTLKVPNISISNFAGNSGISIDNIGKEVSKAIFHHLKKTLEKEGITAGEKAIEATLRREIEQKFGLESGLKNIKNQFDTDQFKNKAKDLFNKIGL